MKGCAMVWSLAACLVAGAAQAADEPPGVLGVVMLAAADDDGALADNLGEVVMAHLALTPGRQLVGGRELQHRARQRALPGCLEQPRCLAGLAAAAGVRRVVTGVVSREGVRFQLTLSLTDVASGQVEARTSRWVEGGLSALVRAAQDATDELFQPAHAPPAAQPHPIDPQRRRPAESAGAELPEPRLQLPPGTPELRQRRGRGWYLYGTGAGALLCLSTGAVFGVLSEVSPSGRTRGEAQRDLERRAGYGRLGTSLLVGGVALSAAFTVLLSRSWRDVGAP
jgi:hypothetical protein